MGVAQDPAAVTFRANDPCILMTPPVADTDARRLRLALVLWNGNIGGAETFTAALARAFRDADIEARVVIVTHAEPLAQRLLETGIPFEALGLRRGRAVLWHARRFARTLTAVGVDGAILVAGGYLALALRLGGYRGRIAAVEHGTVLHINRMRPPLRLRRRVDRLLGARAVDVHVAVSDFVRGHIQTGSRPVVTIPNGVDLDMYQPVPSTRSRDTFVIGCMARLIEGKGVEDALVAAQEVVPRGGRLRIAGDGPDRPKLEQLAEQLGIRENVDFFGWLHDASDVAGFWRECDIAVAAPNDLVESFGLAPVEAMACGTPAVVTRTGALPETVIHGRTGFVVEPGDTHALAAALLAYLEDSSMLAAHGAAARKWCEQRFDIRRCAKAYSALLRGHLLLSPAGSAGATVAPRLRR
jgi:glycosyltransferase involved in cell wall biosynthesis